MPLDLLLRSPDSNPASNPDVRTRPESAKAVAQEFKSSVRAATGVGFASSAVVQALSARRGRSTSCRTQAQDKEYPTRQMPLQSHMGLDQCH